MSFRAMTFSSLEEMNRYFEANLNVRPLTIAVGHVANSLIILADDPGMKGESMPIVVEEEPVAKPKSHKEPPAEPEEPEEEKPEEEERPEEPAAPVGRTRQPQKPRLPVRGAKHQTVEKRKRR